MALSNMGKRNKPQTTFEKDLTMKVTTKLNKDAAAVETNLSINWDGITTDQLKAGYTSFMVVKLQGQWRNKESIPTELTVKAVDYVPGTRAPAMSLQDAIKALTPEEKAKLLAELQA